MITYPISRLKSTQILNPRLGQPALSEGRRVYQVRTQAQIRVYQGRQGPGTRRKPSQKFKNKSALTQGKKESYLQQNKAYRKQVRNTEYIIQASYPTNHSRQFHCTPASRTGTTIIIIPVLVAGLTFRTVLVFLLLLRSISAIDGSFNELNDGLIGRPGASLSLALPLTLAPAPIWRWRVWWISDQGTALEVAPSGPRKATTLVVVGDSLLRNLHLREECIVDDVGGGVVTPRVPELAVPGDEILHGHEGRTMRRNSWEIGRKRIVRQKGRDFDPELGRLAENRRNVRGRGLDR